MVSGRKRIMRIRRIQVELRPARAVKPAFRWRNGLPGSDGPSVHAVLRVQTDEGIEHLWQQQSNSALAEQI
jgi:hypothetical protein